MPNDNNPDNSSSFWQQYGVPIVSGAGSLLNSGLNWLSNWFIGRQNQQFAEIQATTAFERQQQLIREQRAYDNPLAQMQRLIDAGLNPNLIYSDLGDGMPAASAPQGAVPEIRSPNLDAGVNAALQQRFMNAQIREMESKTDLTYAEAQRIIKITPVEFNLINSQSERLQQIITSEDFQASVNALKSKLLKDNEPVSVQLNRGDGTFDMICTNFRDLVLSNHITELYASKEEYKLMLDKLMSDILGVQSRTEGQKLENKKLDAFLQFAEEIYSSQADQSAYLAAMARLNQSLFQSLETSPATIRLAFQALQMILGGIGTFK